MRTRTWVTRCTALLLVGGVVAGVGTSARGAGHASPPGPQNGRIFFSTGFVLPNPTFEEDGITPQVYSVNPDGSDLTQLTHVRQKPGIGAGAPSVSPDGTTVAYVSNQNGDFALFMMDADGKHQHQVLTTPDTDYFTPSWSPDGGTIVMSSCDNRYFGEFDCALVTVNADGTGLRPLLENHRVNVSPTYSPSGTRIQFSSDQKGLRGAVWIMPATGGTPRQVTPAALEAGQAAWAPDGRHLALGSNCCQPDGNVYQVQPDGGGLTKLTHAPFPHGAGFPAYSPDGASIVFASDQASDHGDLFVMDADGRHQHRITTDVDVPVQSSWGVVPGTATAGTAPRTGRHSVGWTAAGPDDVTFDPGASAAPDGRIAFHDARRGVIETINPDGTARQDVTTQDEGYAFDSAWTPDGTHLVTALIPPEGGGSSLFEVAADGSALHRITRAGAGRFDYDPQVTPDGQWIIYSSFRPDPPGGSALWAVRLDGSDRHPVTPYHSRRVDGGEFLHAVSPDGTRLAYEEAGQDGIAEQTWVGDLNGDAVLSGAHPITAAADEAASFSWTADGEYVLGQDNWAHLNAGIDAFPAAGGDPIPLVHRAYPDQAFDPFGSPSGLFMVYGTEDEAAPINQDLYVSDADGSNRRLIETGTDRPQHPQWGTAPLLPASAATPAAIQQPPLSPDRLAQIRAAMPAAVRAELDR